MIGNEDGTNGEGQASSPLGSANEPEGHDTNVSHSSEVDRASRVIDESAHGFFGRVGSNFPGVRRSYSRGTSFRGLEDRYKGAHGVNLGMGFPRVASTELPSKIQTWLSDSDIHQCRWAVQYIYVRGFSSQTKPGPIADVGWEPEDYRAFIEWMLCGRSYMFNMQLYIHVQQALNHIRANADKLFLNAKNAWNQHRNRLRRAEEAANSIVVDPETKKNLSSLSSQYKMSEQELLSSIVDLLIERRSNIKELHKRRMEAKKAALMVDLGLDKVPDDGGGSL